jgi:hypothetical protein
MVIEFPHTECRFTMPKPPLPDALTEIQKGLPADWKLDLFKYWAMAWLANLSCGKKRFQLVCDRDYINVYEIVEGTAKQIVAPEDQRKTITPSQVCQLLLSAVH